MCSQKVRWCRLPSGAAPAANLQHRQPDREHILQHPSETNISHSNEGISKRHETTKESGRASKRPENANGPPPRIPAVSIMVKIFTRASKCWIRSGETSNALSDRLTGGLGMTRAKTAPVIQWQQTSQDTKADIHPQTTKLKNLEVAMQQSRTWPSSTTWDHDSSIT